MKNEVYSLIFDKFFNNQPLTDEEQFILSGGAHSESEDAPTFYEFPDAWMALFKNMFQKSSKLVYECRMRTGSLDRIIIPELITYDIVKQYYQPVKWPGETAESAAGTEFKLPDQTRLITVVTAAAELMTDGIQQCVHVLKNNLERGLFMGNRLYEGVTRSDTIIGRRSEGLRTQAGYVELPSDQMNETTKTMLLHLRSTFRGRANWHISKNVDLEQFNEINIEAMRLYNKPIILCDWMDEEFPIVYGAFSRGYVIGRNQKPSLRKLEGEGRYQFMFHEVGVILQPEAFKVAKRI